MADTRHKPFGHHVKSKDRSPMLVTSNPELTVDNIVQGIRVLHRERAISITALSHPKEAIPQIVKAWGLSMAYKVVQQIAFRNHQEVSQYAYQLSSRCASENMNNIKHFILGDIQDAFSADEIAVHGPNFLRAVQLHLRQSLTNFVKSTKNQENHTLPFSGVNSSQIVEYTHQPSRDCSQESVVPGMSPRYTNLKPYHGEETSTCYGAQSTSSPHPPLSRWIRDPRRVTSAPIPTISPIVHSVALSTTLTSPRHASLPLDMTKTKPIITRTQGHFDQTSHYGQIASIPSPYPASVSLHDPNSNMKSPQPCIPPLQHPYLRYPGQPSPSSNQHQDPGMMENPGYQQFSAGRPPTVQPFRQDGGHNQAAFRHQYRGIVSVSPSLRNVNPTLYSSAVEQDFFRHQFDGNGSSPHAVENLTTSREQTTSRRNSLRNSRGKRFQNLAPEGSINQMPTRFVSLRSQGYDTFNSSSHHWPPQGRFERSKESKTFSIDQNFHLRKPGSEPFPDFTSSTGLEESSNNMDIYGPKIPDSRKVTSSYIGHDIENVDTIWVGMLPECFSNLQIEAIFKPIASEARVEHTSVSKGNNRWAMVYIGSTSKVRECLQLNGVEMVHGRPIYVSVPIRFHTPDYEGQPLPYYRQRLSNASSYPDWNSVGRFSYNDHNVNQPSRQNSRSNTLIRRRSSTRNGDNILGKENQTPRKKVSANSSLANGESPTPKKKRWRKGRDRSGVVEKSNSMSPEKISSDLAPPKIQDSEETLEEGENKEVAESANATNVGTDSMIIEQPDFEVILSNTDITDNPVSEIASSLSPSKGSGKNQHSRENVNVTAGVHDMDKIDIDKWPESQSTFSRTDSKGNKVFTVTQGEKTRKIRVNIPKALENESDTASERSQVGNEEMRKPLSDSTPDADTEIVTPESSKSIEDTLKDISSPTQSRTEHSPLRNVTPIIPLRVPVRSPSVQSGVSGADMTDDKISKQEVVMVSGDSQSTTFESLPEVSSHDTNAAEELFKSTACTLNNVSTISRRHSSIHKPEELLSISAAPKVNAVSAKVAPSTSCRQSSSGKNVASTSQDNWVNPFKRQVLLEKQQRQAAKNQKKKEKKKALIVKASGTFRSNSDASPSRRSSVKVDIDIVTPSTLENTSIIITNPSKAELDQKCSSEDGNDVKDSPPIPTDPTSSSSFLSTQFEICRTTTSDLVVTISPKALDTQTINSGLGHEVEDKAGLRNGAFPNILLHQSSVSLNATTSILIPPRLRSNTGEIYNPAETRVDAPPNTPAQQAESAQLSRPFVPSYLHLQRTLSDNTPIGVSPKDTSGSPKSVYYTPTDINFEKGSVVINTMPTEWAVSQGPEDDASTASTVLVSTYGEADEKEKKSKKKNKKNKKRKSQVNDDSKFVGETPSTIDSTNTEILKDKTDRYVNNTETDTTVSENHDGRNGGENTIISLKRESWLKTSDQTSV